MEETFFSIFFEDMWLITLFGSTSHMVNNSYAPCLRSCEHPIGWCEYPCSCSLNLNLKCKNTFRKLPGRTKWQMVCRAWQEERAAAKGRKTATSPLVVRFLWNSRERQLQNASSDRNRIGKNRDYHQVGMFLHHKTSFISPRLLQSAASPHVLVLRKSLLTWPSGTAQDGAPRNDWCNNFQCFTGKTFFFFQWHFYPEIKAVGSSANTKTPLKG